MPLAWLDRPQKMDSRRFAPAGFRRARSVALRHGAAHRPTGKGGRLPGGPDGPQVITRAACQRVGETRVPLRIGAGTQRGDASADHTRGAQAASARGVLITRVPTGLRAVKKGKGAFGGRAGRPTPPGYRANLYTRTKGRIMDRKVSADTAALVAAQLTQAEMAITGGVFAGRTPGIAAQIAPRTVEKAYLKYLAFIEGGAVLRG